MDKQKLAAAAVAWIDAWNAGDVEKILDHYSDEIEFVSPTVVRRWNKPDGKLIGREAVENHFRKALQEVPGMRMEFDQLLFGVNSVIILYRRENGLTSADKVTFDEMGKVDSVHCYYQAD